MVQGDGGPRHGQTGQPGEVVLVEEKPGLGKLDGGRVQRRRRLAGRYLAEVLLDPLAGLLHIDVAGHHQRRVVGTVPKGVELLGVGEGRGVEVRQRADHLPAVGVSFRVQRLVDHEVGVAVGPVVHALALLVLDDLLLLGDHRLGHGVDEESQLVGLGPKSLLQSVDRHHFEVVGAVAARGAVGGAADAGHEAVESAGAQVLRVQEEEVLEEVSESGAPLDLSGRAHVEGHGDRRQRVRAVHMENDFQPVVELEALEVDGARGVGAGAGGKVASGSEEGEGCDSGVGEGAGESVGMGDAEAACRHDGGSFGVRRWGSACWESRCDGSRVLMECTAGRPAGLRGGVGARRGRIEFGPIQTWERPLAVATL